MNSTALDHAMHSLRRGFISDETFVLIDYGLGYVMAIISFVGVVTNSINIRTFMVMGLGDGMTVTLMSLATSDLAFTFFGCILGFSHVIASIETRDNLQNLPIQPMFVFGMFSANIGIMFYNVTCMTTTFMAIARAMCVAMPFKFKDFFTRSRSIFALVVFYLLAAASYVPILSQMGTQRKFDPVVNRTRIVLWMSPMRKSIKDVVIFMQSFVFVFVSSFVVGVCIVIMAKFLKQSKKFRYMSTKGMTEGDIADKEGYKLSGKELQIVQQVIIICIIYTLSVVPSLFVAVYRFIEDEFDVGKRLHNLYFVFSQIVVILELINSASTFPVYFVYNSKFRSHCFSM